MKKAFALALIMAFSWGAAGCSAEPPPAGENALTISFLDVGKADAILIQTENSAVLVDTAEDKTGDQVADFIERAGVTRLDALIITHFDKDHVGGADKVLRRVPVQAVYQPLYEKESKQYAQYLQALAERGLSPDALAENYSFELDGVRYAIDVANRDFYGSDEENDFSLVISLTWGKTRALLAGDAENPRLGELIEEGDLGHGLLKVAHHGVAEKLSAQFIGQVSPQYAVITSSDEEREDEEVVQALGNVGTEVLLTREGPVVLKSDGASWKQVKR